MNRGFNAEFKIPYSAVKPDLIIAFPKLMEILQETSIYHTESTNYPMKWYSENEVGFLLINWQVNIVRYPSLYDTIKVWTWPIAFKGVLAERYFEAVDQMGEVLAAANSKWVFTDLNKRRPVKPTADLIEGYGAAMPSAFERDYELPDLTGYNRIAFHDFVVTRRELDSNFHVNNIKYMEWALDLIPESIYNQLNISHMRAAYKKECALGAHVLVEMYQNPVAHTELMAVVRSFDKLDQIMALVYTCWKA